MVLIRSHGGRCSYQSYVSLPPLANSSLSNLDSAWESTPYLECADALVILTFEEEVDFRPCGGFVLRMECQLGPLAFEVSMQALRGWSMSEQVSGGHVF